MSIFAVQYTYTDDTAARDEHRPHHRAYLGTPGEKAEVVLSGPFAAGVGQSDGALILVQAENVEDVLEFLSSDPFQVNGLVERVQVRGWSPVMGSWHASLADRL
ncbi:MAG: YciI family protein [Propioniciclava sp.]|uniref:YciI family protein n=1 Tax=Propioniciclava sp. TaxID=2038686 RepID=UPI0039E612F5